MRPFLEKLMMLGFMVSGLCTGTYLFRGSRDKTLEDLLEENERPVLDLDAKQEDDEGYGEWERKISDLKANRPEELKKFIGENEDNPGQEVTVEELREKCEVLLVKTADEESQDYKDADLFCTEYEEMEEGDTAIYK